MSLFQFNIKSRIELETRVLAAALKQSFELGDNDGVSLAHRQLSLLLKENKRGNGGTTGTSTTTESPALPEEEVLTGEDNGAHSEKEDDNGDGGHFEQPLPTPEVEFTEVPLPTAEVEFSDVPLPSRDEWGRVARTFDSYQFDENGELLKAERSVPVDFSGQEAADNAELTSADKAENDTTYDTSSAEPAADPQFEPPALAFEYTNFSAQILDQERSGENPIVEAVDEIAVEEEEPEKIAAETEDEFEPEFPIEDRPTETETESESEDQTDSEFGEEPTMPDDQLPAAEPRLPYSADQSTVELSSEAAVQATEPESEETEPVAAEVESELDQAAVLTSAELEANKPQPYEITEAFPSQNLADLSRLSQSSGNLLTDMQAQALAAPSFYNPPLLDPPSKGWAVPQIEDLSAVPSLDQSVQRPVDDAQPAAAAIDQPPPAVAPPTAAESFAPEEAVEKAVETPPPTAPNVVRKEAPTRNLFEQMQQFEVPVEVDRPKGYEYDLVSQSGTYLIPEDLPPFSTETFSEARAAAASADAPAPATTPVMAAETPTHSPAAANPNEAYPSPGGPLGKTNARQTFTRLPQPPQPPPPAPPTSATLPTAAVVPSPPPAQAIPSPPPPLAVPDLGLPRLAQPKPLPHLQEEVSPPPPVEMPENMYALLSVSQMSPQRDIHKSCLRKTRKVLRALKGKAKPERDVLLRELRRLWIAHDILVDPVTRTDYDFRELGLRGAEASPIALPDDSHSSQLGSRTPLRVGELLQCAGLLETAELEIACDMHKAMPEVQFGTFLVKQGFIQERDLDSVLLGQQLLREGKITVAQFQVAMELSQSRGVPISETLIEHGYLREEDLKPDEPPEQNLVPPDAVPTVREVPLRPKAQELVRAELNQGKTVPTWKDQLDWSKPTDEAVAASDERTPEKQSLGNLLDSAPEAAEKAQKVEPVFSWKDQFDWEKPAEYAQAQEALPGKPTTPASAWQDQFDWSKPAEYAAEKASQSIDDALDSGNEPQQTDAPRKKTARKKDDGKKDKRKKQPKK